MNIERCDGGCPVSQAAKEWQGWGTALKPAFEPIVVARKPFGGTVAENVQKWGCGAINIDGCRVATAEQGKREHGGKVYEGVAEGYKRPNKSSYTHKTDWHMQSQGHWPANLIHDGSEEVLELFPKAPGQQGRARIDGKAQGNNVYGALKHITKEPNPRGDSGSAARFFYCAKASKSERGEGNNHPTVKPLALMQYLLKLVVREDETVLDPFAGSGSTLIAAAKLGLNYVGIDEDEACIQLAERRIHRAIEQEKEGS